MANRNSSFLDVGVIGGGPAGISACLELSRSPGIKVALFESETQIGGIPRTCHFLFGLRDLKRMYTGHVYAQKLDSLIRKTSVEIYTNTTVLKMIPGKDGGLHQIDVLSPKGLTSYGCRFVLLATGCFESSCSVRSLPGTRPSGVFTTGMIQELVRSCHQKPGTHALIIGSEHVALSCVLTLRRTGTSIAGIVEEDSELQTYPIVAKAMSSFLGFPIYKGTSVNAIFGDRRVEGVELTAAKDHRMIRIECDTVVISGKFRAYSPLIDNTSIERDPLTFGPVVDTNLMTSVPNIFAAGNILRGGDMNDLCALEGKQAARNILKRLESVESQSDECISIAPESPIRYVVPQKIISTQRESCRSSWFFPGIAIQMERTLKASVLEAWSGNEKIWEAFFPKLIGNHRIPLPIQKFNWSKVDKREGITLRVRES